MVDEIKFTPLKKEDKLYNIAKGKAEMVYVPKEEYDTLKKATSGLGSPRIGNIMRFTITSLLFLTVYFLGVNSMIWTADQVREYAYDICAYDPVLGGIPVGQDSIPPLEVVNNQPIVN